MHSVTTVEPPRLVARPTREYSGKVTPCGYLVLFGLLRKCHKNYTPSDVCEAVITVRRSGGQRRRGQVNHTPPLILRTPHQDRGATTTTGDPGKQAPTDGHLQFPNSFKFTAA